MNLRLVKTCLENIFDIAFDHPCCDKGLFESKDIKALCEIGGDICDWTMIAIEAQKALDVMEVIK